MLRDSVALFERDGGMLWKHYDIDRNYNESRRGRQLVLMFIATVGNYDYALNWIFHQDGALEFRADLTGIMLTKGVAESRLFQRTSRHAEPRRARTTSTSSISASTSTSTASRTASSNRTAARSGTQPVGQRIRDGVDKLASEKAAQRELSWPRSASGRSINPAAKNALGSAGYLLIPGDNSLPFVTKTAPVRKRAAFLGVSLLGDKVPRCGNARVGLLPEQSTGGDGLEKWTADDEALDKTDVVV
jgi:primary-amine oxidase